MAPGWPGVVGATLERSRYSPSVSQKELLELERGFGEISEIRVASFIQITSIVII
jgi:hypothetical protein